MSEDYKSLAEGLLPSVLAAGARVMHYFGSPRGVETKSDGSPVSVADREAERILIDALRRVAPNIPVVAEEAASSGHFPETGDRFFLVDPLDGTKEFIGGRNEFTVNVGLVSDGVPEFGIIYAPALGQMYLTLSEQWAIFVQVPQDQKGLSLSDLVSGALPLKTRSMPSAGGVSVVASRSHGSDALEAWLQSVNVAQRLSIGSSLKFCLIAQGDADIYPRFGPTMEWDTAAGHAIVSAAGGVVTLEDCSTPLHYGKREKDYLNPSFIVWGRRENCKHWRGLSVS